MSDAEFRSHILADHKHFSAPFRYAGRRTGAHRKLRGGNQRSAQRLQLPHRRVYRRRAEVPSPVALVVRTVNFHGTYLTVSIPEREFEVRKDLRQDRVFTIDPPSAKDLDDALSIKANEDGTHTVGVHIADVSYFGESARTTSIVLTVVKPNTALDRDARKRATSVYLVQRAVPMLPPQLSEELCSLRPNEERLAFTASFTVDQNGSVIKTDFTRTIIK